MPFSYSLQSEPPEIPRIVSVKLSGAAVPYEPSPEVITQAHEYCRIPETNSTAGIAQLLKTAAAMVETYLRTPIHAVAHNITLEGQIINRFPLPKGNAIATDSTVLSVQRGFQQPYEVIDTSQWEIVGSRLTVREYCGSGYENNHRARWLIADVKLGLWEEINTEPPANFFTALYQTVAYLYANRGDMNAPMLSGGIPPAAAAMLVTLRNFK